MHPHVHHAGNIRDTSSGHDIWAHEGPWAVPPEENIREPTVCISDASPLCFNMVDGYAYINKYIYILNTFIYIYVNHVPRIHKIQNRWFLRAKKNLPELKKTRYIEDKHVIYALSILRKFCSRFLDLTLIECLASTNSSCWGVATAMIFHLHNPNNICETLHKNVLVA